MKAKSLIKKGSETSSSNEKDATKDVLSLFRSDLQIRIALPYHN